MKKLPEILKTKLVAESHLFKVEAVDLQFSNGEKRTFERLQRRYRGAVMIVPITEKQELILIREYAVGIEGYELTFPKGFIDPGESALEAANRELKEETGFGTRECRILKTLATSPAYMGSQLTLVLAQDLYAEKLPGDEPEPLEVVHWPIYDYHRLLATSEFISAMSVAALLLVKETLNFVTR